MLLYSIMILYNSGPRFLQSSAFLWFDNAEKVESTIEEWDEMDCQNPSGSFNLSRCKLPKSRYPRLAQCRCIASRRELPNISLDYQIPTGPRH